jgi:hypothetical protein
MVTNTDQAIKMAESRNDLDLKSKFWPLLDRDFWCRLKLAKMASRTEIPVQDGVEKTVLLICLLGIHCLRF